MSKQIQTDPVVISFETITTTPQQWFTDYLLVYILQGKVNIQINENNYHLVEDDLVLINAYDLHSFKASECKIAKFRFNPYAFQVQPKEGMRVYFDCNSTTTTNKEVLVPLKKYLALLVKYSQSTENNKLLLQYSYTYALLHHLLSHYHVKSTQPLNTARQRLADLLAYINTHYKEPITLKSIAAEFYLTPPYLSKLLKESLNMNFKDYINTLRLNSALMDLKNIDLTIDYVSDINGFSNARSFVQVFKSKYGILPSDFRKDLSKHITREDHVFQRNTIGLVHQSTLGRLAEYISKPDSFDSAGDETVKYTEIPPINTQTKGLDLDHTFKQVTTIGMARHLLLANFQDMLKDLQKDIGFHYIKFHGLLDDEMMVYSESPSGQPILNFTYVDMIFDFLLSINLRPLIQLSYMPTDLAKNPEMTINFLESCVSLPKDYNKWQYLIRNLVIHLQNRYGPEEVRKWPFYLWNTPDAPEALSGIKDKEDYFYFYQVTYKTVVGIDPQIAFGGPGLMNMTMEKGDWVTAFLSYCRENDCQPAFLNYHFYPVIPKDTLSSKSLTESHLMLDPSEDALRLSINKIKQNNRNLGWNMKNFYITEWNSSISHRELLNDTAFKPPYIVKNILENYDRMASFAYWGLTDYIEEVQMSGRLFHGGIGLFTYNGIKKAQYYAFTFLSRLGDQLLDRGDGYFVTKKGSSYQIILYNYQHYSSLYASGELFDMTFENRYTPFPDLHKFKFILTLDNLEESNYIIADRILNRQNGSGFDKWIDLGAMALETEEEVDYLKSVSLPKIEKTRESTDDKKLILSRVLEPHEVRLIELKPEVLL